MTTQPTAAVGSEAPAPAAATDPFDAIASEMLGEEQEEEEQPAETAEEEAPEAQAEADEEAEDEPEVEEEEELPPIDPPNSLNAEDKEAFKNLPREAQEFTARRIGEMEKGFQTKAQEVAAQKQALQLEALQAVEQVKAQAAEQLQNYARQFEVQPPSAELFRTNPEAYAQQLESYQYYTAQGQKAQRDADQVRAEQDQIRTAREAHEAEVFRQRLAAEMPEIFDPETGQQLAKELNATAELLGFDPNQISDVSAIKALKATSEWKAKADKYDSIMRKRMEKVRSGKSPPPISKPGTARSPEQNRNARADAAWQAATKAKTRNQRDDALADWAEQSGFLD